MTQKTLRRFFLEKIDPFAERCTLSGPEARHIRKVLRMGAGQQLVLVDGQGRRFLGSIDSATSQEVCITLVRALNEPPAPVIEIVLCQALLKSQAMDLIIQKATELGVSRVVPFFSERTVVYLKGAQKDNKLRRWREIARMATTQSDRHRPPDIEPPLTYQELLSRYRDHEEACRVILWERGGSVSLKSCLRKASAPNRFVGMIGPEGGFSEQEVEQAEAAGFVSVGAGQRILRAETAAITFVGILQYEWGDLGLDVPAGEAAAVS